MRIDEIIKKYRSSIGIFELELLTANTLKKTREFVLSHPEFILNESQISNLESEISRRLKREPIAYILGHKEFYGLEFMVNKHTLIPRPETEIMVERVLDLLRSMLRSTLHGIVIDVGTGSGCIITSITHNMKDVTCNKNQHLEYFATDISKEALMIAKKNAGNHGLNKKIKFMHGSLLAPVIENSDLKIENSTIIITANLPYLSKDIYNSAPIDVKKYEPKSALYSPEAGLQHYKKLLQQIKQLTTQYSALDITCYMEISPEQKDPIKELINSIIPQAKMQFIKDLAGKWRICIVTI